MGAMKRSLLPWAFAILVGLFLFLNLGDRPLWGVEGRWAEGVREMMLRGDWWVPTINGKPHVTKPLIPYWLIRLTAEIRGELDELTVRIPVALCGALTLIAFYVLARRFFSSWEALTATGILATTWGFAGYARVAQSEIYQLAGIVSALAFYVWFRERKSPLGYLGFWTAALFAALSKGLPGFAVPVLVVTVDILLARRFYHLNILNFSIAFLAVLLYFLHYLGIARAMGSDLPFYLIVRENLTQVVDPYDNQEPFYVYFYYLPQLLLPWSLFFLAALGYSLKNFHRLSGDHRFLFLALIAVFLLFDLARARRSYYILPAVPLAVLLILYYLKIKGQNPDKLSKFLSYSYGLVTLLLGFVLLLAPALPGISDRIPSGYNALVVFTGGGMVAALLWCVLARTSPWGLIFSFLFLAISGLAILTPALTSPSEKVFGRTLARISQTFPEAKICGYEKISANLFFYLSFPEPIPIYHKPKAAQKDCDLVFFRERIYKKASSESKRAWQKGDMFAVERRYRSRDDSKNYLLWRKDPRYLVRPPLIPYMAGSGR